MTKIVIAGDSTAAIKEDNKRPETGWGEKMSQFLPDDFQIINLAMNGRSTKSFIHEDRLLEAEQLLSPGDYFIIQFGHNDQKLDTERGTTPEQYQENLAAFVAAAHKKQATPLLLTSITRLKYDEAEQLDPLAVGPYPEAMKQFAKTHGVACLDMFTITQDYFSKLTPTEARKHFLHLSVDEHPNYPEGICDNTHLNDYGATVIARLICETIKNSTLPLRSVAITL
jgi:lysophospholipase L1-like esterase